MKANSSKITSLKAKKLAGSGATKDAKSSIKGLHAKSLVGSMTSKGKAPKLKAKSVM